MPKRAKPLTFNRVQSLKAKDHRYQLRDGKVTGLFVRVLPSGSKRYYMQPKRGGKTYLIGDANILTLEQARLKAMEIHTSVASGNDPDPKKSSKQSLADFIKNHYETWAKAHGKTEIAKHRERVIPVVRIRRNFKSFLPKPMTDITVPRIERWRTGRLNAGKSPATVNRDVTDLRSVLSKAVEWEILQEHPLNGLKPLKLENDGRIRYLTSAEEKRLEKAMAEFGGYIVPFVKLALNTGMRRGELYNLKWDDVDFRTRILTVTESKSGKARHIPLNSKIIEVLKEWRSNRNLEIDWVFPGRDGNKLVEVKRQWKNLMEAARIENFTLHECRHHFCSKLVMSGVDLVTVKELAGHAQIQMTMRYSHLSPEHKRNAVEEIAF